MVVVGIGGNSRFEWAGCLNQARRALERFQAKWKPVHVMKTRRLNKLERVRTQNRRPFLLDAL
jgi:hypothetical protein